MEFADFWYWIGVVEALNRLGDVLGCFLPITLVAAIVFHVTAIVGDFYDDDERERYEKGARLAWKILIPATLLSFGFLFLPSRTDMLTIAAARYHQDPVAMTILKEMAEKPACKD